jgi:hypothetical protein
VRAKTYIGGTSFNDAEYQQVSALCAMITESPSAPEEEVYYASIHVLLVRSHSQNGAQKHTILGLAFTRPRFQDGFWFAVHRNGTSAHLSSYRQARTWFGDSLDFLDLSLRLEPSSDSAMDESCLETHVLWDSVERMLVMERTRFHNLLRAIISQELYGASPSYLDNGRYFGVLPTRSASTEIVKQVRVFYLKRLLPYEEDIERAWSSVILMSDKNRSVALTLPLQERFLSSLRRLIFRWLSFSYGTESRYDVHWQLTTNRLFMRHEDVWYVYDGENPIQRVLPHTVPLGSATGGREQLLLTSEDIVATAPKPSPATLEKNTSAAHIIRSWYWGADGPLHNMPCTLDLALEALYSCFHDGGSDSQHTRVWWPPTIPGNVNHLEILMHCEYAISKRVPLKTITLPRYTRCLVAHHAVNTSLHWTVLHYRRNGDGTLVSLSYSRERLEPVSQSAIEIELLPRAAMIAWIHD